MKFILTDTRKRYTDQELIDDLRRVAGIIGGNTVTKTHYERHGRFQRRTISTRFGSWANVLSKAGLSSEHLKPAEADHLIEDLRRVATVLQKSFVTLADYRRLGKWSEEPFYRHFGSWQKALKSAGLDRSPAVHDRISDENYFENIERMWISLGRQPKYKEVEKPFSTYSARAYEQRFGSWRKALNAFVAFVNTDQQTSEQPKSTSSLSPSDDNPNFTQKDQRIISGVKRRRTPRVPSLRLRFLVMRRDDFKCCICGASPALKRGTVLVVDHVVSWDDGGETVMENLQTLCEPCNSGKSNLKLISTDQG